MPQETKPLEYCLALEYSFSAIADPDGGYVVVFPDLPGCMTQGDTLDEVRRMAEEARALWIEAEYDTDPSGIPMPSYPADCGGEFAPIESETAKATQETKPLEYYLALEYSFSAIADPDGGYVVVFPDLPGCMTQVESLDEIPYMVEDVRAGWLETVYDANPNGIPLPSYPADCGDDDAPRPNRHPTSRKPPTSYREDSARALREKQSRKMPE